MGTVTGQLYVISAPSGTGKTTVVRALLDRHPDLIESISYTTRDMRPGDRAGIDYHFVNIDDFKKLADEGFFAEWAEVYGNFYGTPKKPISEAVERGEKVILDIDVQGGMAIKKHFPDSLAIFLLPPSEEELVRRLRGRGTDAEGAIERRLATAKQELIFQDRYDRRVVNDNVDRAVAEIENLIYG
jgi:guanylate kinase